MDRAAIARVGTWFQRMLVNAQRAVDLASRLSVRDLHESNDLFWALAKYAENVQESISQLDNVNERILTRLIEIPVRSDVEGDATWTGLKGMRSKLAHQFWGIDPEVLRATVAEDFPKLIDLLLAIRLSPEPVGKGEQFGFSFRRSDWSSLPFSKGRGKPSPGQTLLYLWFDEEGNPEAFRVGKRGDKTALLWSSTPISVIGTFGVKYGPEGQNELTQIGPSLEVG